MRKDDKKKKLDLSDLPNTTHEHKIKYKKKRSGLYFGYHVRIIFWFLIFFIFLVVCLLFASKTLEREKLNPINYNQSSRVDYKVYLNENDFYDEEYLEMNKAYVASLIKYIDVDFSYAFDIATITDMNFDYNILADLIIENNGGTKKYFEKTYTLLENKEEKIENNSNISIKENLKIDYNYYNLLANNFRITYGLDTNSYLNVYMEVKSKTSDKLNYKIDETTKIPLKIPLSERAIEINFNSNNNDVSKFVVPEGKIIFNSKFLILESVFFIITTICFIKFIKYLVLSFKEETMYDKYVNKLLKEYDRLIVETYTSMDMTNLNVIELKEFTEILDVRDNLKVPILYYNIVKHEKGIFYIKDNNDIYLLTVKNVDLVNKKTKKKK